MQKGLPLFFAHFLFQGCQKNTWCKANTLCTVELTKINMMTPVVQSNCKCVKVSIIVNYILQLETVHMFPLYESSQSDFFTTARAFSSFIESSFFSPHFHL